MSYTDTEYVEMMIVAGWITAESCDPEYQEYLSITERDEPLSYKSWQGYKEEYAKLCEEHEILHEQYMDNRDLTYEQRYRMTDLEKQIYRLEVALGY